MLEWNWNATAVRAAVRPADPSTMNPDGCSRGKQNARREQYGSGVGNRPLNNTGPRAPDLLTERCGRGRVCCDLKHAREAELRSGYTDVLVGRAVFVERNDILPLVQVARNLDDGPQAAISMAYSAEHRLVCRCWHWTCACAHTWSQRVLPQRPKCGHVPLSKESGGLLGTGHYGRAWPP